MTASKSARSSRTSTEPGRSLAAGERRKVRRRSAVPGNGSSNRLRLLFPFPFRFPFLSRRRGGGLRRRTRRMSRPPAAIAVDDARCAPARGNERLTMTGGKRPRGPPLRHGRRPKASSDPQVRPLTKKTVCAFGPLEWRHMKSLVVGGGGREHALCWALRASPLVSELYCAPGNPGIAEVADCLPVSSGNIVELADFAEKLRIDLTVVGPEVPLSLGIADLFAKRELPIFGPSRLAAQIETSKVFAKEFFG